MSPGRHDKIEVGRIDKGGFEDEDTAENIGCSLCFTLFLGGKEKSTLKEISEVLGKETIDLYNTSETRSNNNSYGLNYQKTGKELMSQDEIAVMDGAKCILQLRGVRPFLSNKYDINTTKIGIASLITRSLAGLEW